MTKGTGYVVALLLYLLVLGVGVTGGRIAEAIKESRSCTASPQSEQR